MGINVTYRGEHFAMNESRRLFSCVVIIVISFIILLIFKLLRYVKFRLSLSNLPSCSLEPFFLLYWVTRTIPKEMPFGSVSFTVFLSICKYFEKEGFCLMWGFKPFFFIFDERYVKIFTNDNAALNRPVLYQVLSDMLGKSLLTHNETLWRKRRKMFNPGFRFHVLRDSIEAINKGAEYTVRKIKEQSHKSAVDVLPLLKVGIANTFCESILGIKVSEEKLFRYIKMVSSLSEYSMERGVRPWHWTKYSVMLFGGKYRKVYKELHEFLKEIVTEMMASIFTSDSYEENLKNINGNGKTVRSIIFENFTKDPSFPIEDVVHEVNTLLLGGHDTAAHILLWSLFMLGLHPEIQEKAFEEVEMLTSNTGGYISYDDLSKLKYLESVLKETMRLYPALPLTFRETTQDIDCGKFKIPKDCTVAFLPYLLHRNPNIYPNPETFDPDRFHKKSLKHPWAYIPFQEGIRSCLAKNFALQEMKIILAYILRNFRVTSLDKKEDILLEWKLILAPATPLRFKFHFRNPLLLTSG